MTPEQVEQIKKVKKAKWHDTLDDPPPSNVLILGYYSDGENTYTVAQTDVGGWYFAGTTTKTHAPNMWRFLPKDPTGYKNFP